MTGALDSRIKTTISSVFGVPAASLNDASGPENIPGWDSLHHIHLVVALEAEFSVAFEAEQALALTSVAAIRDMLATLGAS